MNRLILAAYLILATLYSITTPLLEASDEVWHYPFVRHLALNGLQLPVQQPGQETDYRQEGSQPPLYYLIAAVLTAGIDTSDLPAVRRINPHADIGLIVPDRNANMTIHDAAARNPLRGTALAAHLTRLFSVLLGAVTVWYTYRLGRELFAAPEIALLGMALVAFNPMFLFISGSVNNDNLSTALATVLLVHITRLIKRTDAPPIRDLVLIGVLAGMGMLAKFNIGFLLPVIAAALAGIALRLRDGRVFVVGAAITGGLTILIGGWWYVRNWQLYGDPTGLNVFIQIVGPRAIPANAAQLWSERHTFLMSYWGFFGGVNVPFPAWVYTVFNAILAFSAAGLIVGVVRFRRARPPLPILAARALSVIWIVVLFGGLIRWTAETWASQGRLMFAAIAPIALWSAIGVRAWFGEKGVQHGVGGLIAVWFFAMSLYGLLVIREAYTPHIQPPAVDARYTAEFTEPGSESVVLRADGKPLSATLVVPVGAYVHLCPSFQLPPDSRFTRDWSLFLHLENADGLIVAQRDVYLGGGAWATSLLTADSVPGGTWCNPIAIRLPDFAAAPQTLTAYLGFYDIRTGERLVLRGSTDNRLPIATVEVQPRTGDQPNPMRVSLGGEAELIGYQVSGFSTAPNGKIDVTLYWRALRKMSIDYRVFAQIVMPNTTRVFAQSDGMPAQWSRPTSTWAVGEVVADTHTLTLSPDTPAGDWQLIVGLYELREGADGPKFRRLRAIAPDGAETDDFVPLTRIRVR
jgi:hypothetical protein